MSELREVLDSIKAYCTTEYREHYRQRKDDHRVIRPVLSLSLGLAKSQS